MSKNKNLGMRVLPGDEVKTVIHYFMHLKALRQCCHGIPIGRKPPILEDFQTYTGFFIFIFASEASCARLTDI